MTRRIFLISLLLTFVSVIHASELQPYTASAATPALKLRDMNNKEHDLNQYKGQIVLVQFWATYCTPCRKEMPSMNKMMTKMGKTPFKILAVNMGETEDEVKTFVNEVKPAFTILMDPAGNSIADWRVFAAPSNFIIGPDGKIRYTLFGGVEWDSEELIAKLQALAK
ncbi:MAG: TlpA family protein disulfide reductase [Gammaproteobacteria bacterium]|jgi:thiol-disulfide isomerase/thioredoxin|nr:TlpA family protein disulfide reductase [Gammaproteobacteria bacterium]HEX5637851.1 TlpA disulfide reductase family protein [Gammaproteobacteria bacterium]